ncbi:DUF202 domain-containing protein [Tomitella biformata]|uniref:DUF202 domain-containing protein n=1 Tax=Tomitella biformata TaxID=630403 RepID=UPI00046664ED|nr:DUF202 domain-containing protein [Tomitella biformata]
MTAAPDIDPGLQPERTALSWRRTALAALVVAALMLRQAASVGTDVAALAPLVGVGILLVLALACYRRGNSLSQGRIGPSNTLARRRVMAATSIAVALGALSAALITLMPT